MGRNFIINDENHTWWFLERILQIKSTRVWETQDGFGIVHLEIHQKKAGLECHRLKTMVARGMRSPRHAINRRRWTREGPEFACVQTLSIGVAHAGGEGRIHILPWYRLVGVAKTSSESERNSWVAHLRTIPGHWNRWFCRKLHRPVHHCSSKWRYSGMRSEVGRIFYYQWRKSDLVIPWKDCTNLEHESLRIHQK